MKVTALKDFILKIISRSEHLQFLTALFDNNIIGIFYICLKCKFCLETWCDRMSEVHKLWKFGTAEISRDAITGQRHVAPVSRQPTRAQQSGNFGGIMAPALLREGSV
jgi:hypothetical protein